MSEAAASLSPSPSPFVVLLCGTYVTGKETLAFTLAEHYGCPKIKAGMSQFSAYSGARTQSRSGRYDYTQVFCRIWWAKLQQLGFPPDEKDVKGPCRAVLSCLATRRQDRDAIREAMRAQSLKPIFIILNITKETLSGRTLGVEHPEDVEFANLKLEEKARFLELPGEDETDVALVDSMLEMDVLAGEIKGLVGRLSKGE